MEVVIPPERLEQTLNVLMNQRNYTLAAFDLKEIAREYLGIKLPTLEVIEPESLESLNQLQIREPIHDLSEKLENTPVHQVEPPSRPSPPHPVQASGKPEVIAPAKQQKGMIEKRIARFLEDAGIRASVRQGEAFYQRIENEPYIPLVIERQGNELMFTHYLEQNGDTFIDAEMVFTIQPNGQLQFKETAVQDPIRGGEWREPDRLFAQVFSRNILQQGFAEAAKAPQAGRDAERDTDGDGLKDAVERSLGTSVNHADTDGDGLSDRQEVQSHLDPLQADTDGD
ncbi:MAG: hypothetical protein WCA35_15585, partial [Kovacikia sp.]